VLFLLLLAAFTLITVDLRGNGGPVTSLRNGAGQVFGPVQNAVSSAVHPVTDWFGGLGGDDKKKLDQLQKENDALRLQQRSQTYTDARAAQLDKLLAVPSLAQYQLLPAQVIAVGREQGFAWTAEIDAGTDDGLHQDMTVLNGDGLVGRVKSVTKKTATILLVTDSDFQAGVRVADNSQLGFVKGNGLDPLDLKLLDPQAQVKTGDTIVTFGSANDNPFVPGVPVGTVTAVRGTAGQLYKEASVKPFVQVTSLDIVAVVLDPAALAARSQIAAGSVPTPAGSPSPSGSATPSGTTSSAGTPAGG
jgi:rod shape-determining protein MreC